MVVIGTKRSGVAAIELLLKQGARVQAMDADPQPIPGLDVPVVPQTPEFLGDVDLVVLSPAVPFDLSMLVEARERGVPVIGEVELASFFLKGPIAGITGANGKTTTTALTGHLFQECGIPCQVGGNIGTAVTSMVDSSREEQWNVLELSSFQLESILQFHVQIGACLNVTPDHLDRHHTFENYAAAKGRLFETQRAGAKAVLNFDDPVCRSYAERTKAHVHWFSLREPVSPGLWLNGAEIVWNDEALLNRSDIRLRGLHNVENVMAATLIALLAGAEPGKIATAVHSFPGVEHRIEFVRALNGVEYFNDSKATNVDASLKAIEAFTERFGSSSAAKIKEATTLPFAIRCERKLRRAADWRSAAVSVRCRADHPARVARRREPRGLRVARTRSRLRSSPCGARRYCAASSGLREFRPVSKLRRAGKNVQTFSGRIVLIPMAQRLKTDWLLFLTVLVMVCFGLVMVYSSSVHPGRAQISTFPEPTSSSGNSDGPSSRSRSCSAA